MKNAVGFLLAFLYLRGEILPGAGSPFLVSCQGKTPILLLRICILSPFLCAITKDSLPSPFFFFPTPPPSDRNALANLHTYDLHFQTHFICKKMTPIFSPLVYFSPFFESSLLFLHAFPPLFQIIWFWTTPGFQAFRSLMCVRIY